MDYILSFENCVKSYPGVMALKNVSMNILRGEVHALIGENGAGKSTLMKCLSGAQQLDSGTIIFDGKSYCRMQPRQARAAGIEVVYQELNLVDSLTVAENVCFGEQYGKLVNYARLEEKADKVFRRMNVRIDTRKLVRELSIAQKQLVEIAKALLKNARLLVMDEPTASLTEDEIEVLFEIIKGLKKEHITVIYISHRLDELFKICDRVSVMRDGEMIGTKNIADIDKQGLIEMMVGRELTVSFPERTKIRPEVMFEIKNMTGNGVKNANLCVHKGEIVGIAGLVGAGRTELARMAFGADQKESGCVLVDGREVKITSPRNAIANGIGLIPEDRKDQGCFLMFGIDWNITIASIKKHIKRGILQFSGLQAKAEEYIDRLRIKTPSPDQLVMNLSGGNQQKVVLAKTLATDANVIIFDEPTRGIDVGAKHEIYMLMNELADMGKAILMISSDMEEMLGMSDRIYVLAEGHIVGEVRKEEATQVKLMNMMSEERLHDEE